MNPPGARIIFAFQAAWAKSYGSRDVMARDQCPTDDPAASRQIAAIGKLILSR
jgi:hypothetical protein